MHRIVAGAIAGLIGTGALSVLMLVKSGMGLMPELDIIAMLSEMMGIGVGAAWGVHFAIGAAWGILFALLAPLVPGSGCWMRGAVYSLAPWFAMMVMIMPMAGAGFFGLSTGVAAPMMTLMLHIIFGAVMGAAFGMMARREDWAGTEVRPAG